MYPEADRNIYGPMLQALHASEITDEVASATFTLIKRRKALSELSERAFKVSQGVEQYEDLREFIQDNLLEETNETTSTFDLPRITTDLEELLEQSYSEQGLRWRLDCLNKSLGSLRDGDFGFIFARPETGKTTFLASETTSMLGGCTRPIVWLNNEEQGSKVMLRVIQSYFGLRLEQLLANPKRYNELFNQQTKDRFHLFDAATISRRDVEAIIKELSPGLVVYDQLDKIKGFSNDREDLRLGSIYQWARELAKGSHAGIGVCQADGTAEGVRYLTMEHVANAKTAKQAEADWILGIGKSHQDGTENIRYLNISKNKLTGDKDSIPDMRHGRFEVFIRPEVGRYEDIVKYD